VQNVLSVDIEKKKDVEKEEMKELL